MFIPQFYPNVGGAERQADLLATTLVAHGLHVEILTVQLETSWPLEDRSPNGIPVHRIPFLDLNRRFPSIRKAGLGVTTLMIAAARTFRAVRRLASRFDILHAHNASGPETAWAVRSARANGLATLVKIVNTGDWFDLALLSKLSRRGRPWLRWIVEGTDRWVAISHSVSNDLLGFGIGADRFIHIPNGVSLPATPVELPDLARRFLHLGRLAGSAPRDIDGLVSAFEAVAEKWTDAALAIVGGGNHLEQVRARAASSVVHARLLVPGHQQPGPWLAWGHSMVHPSFFEGMSNSLLEGMAAGLACVAYDIPPNREVLDGGAAGILVSVGAHGQLAATLRELASVDGLARRWGRRARERAESAYDIRKIAVRTLAAYEDLMSRGTMHRLETKPGPAG